MCYTFRFMETRRTQHLADNISGKITGGGGEKCARSDDPATSDYVCDGVPGWVKAVMVVVTVLRIVRFPRSCDGNAKETV